ncbi:MAG: GMC family oxidoreductase [Bryobacterales bacterium]|nr:GMC family oxidoreductase [Bryobacterales bacterium]
MLATPWNQRHPSYDIIVIGSGYGGAIAAARLADSALTPKPSVCILERGKEYQPGDFPESVPGVLAHARGNLNPLGLYEFLSHQDISIVKGCGLGGTSLINANVAIVPDREVFEQFNWPSAITYDELLPYYRWARQMLNAGPHPAPTTSPKSRPSSSAPPNSASTPPPSTSPSTSPPPVPTPKASNKTPATTAATASPAATSAPKTPSP